MDLKHDSDCEHFVYFRNSMLLPVNRGSRNTDVTEKSQTPGKYVAPGKMEVGED